MDSETMQISETTVAGFPATVGEPAAAMTDTPVLFLHGAFADHACFRGWVERFTSAGYRCIAASRRGRLGIGPERAAGLTFDDYVDDAMAVIRDIGTPPIVVGHSLGGLIAQRLAERERVRAVVLVAPAPPAMLTAQAVALPRFAPVLPKIMSGRPFVVPDGACSVLALNRVPDGERAAIHSHLSHESGKVYRSAMLGTVRVDAGKVRVPVMVVGGQEDRIISTRLLRKTARHYGTEPRVYSGHAHWILEEPGWEHVADDVLAWLAAVL